MLFSLPQPLLPPTIDTIQSPTDGNDTGTEISTSSILDGADTMDISMTESISLDTFNDDVHSIPSEFSSKEVSPEHKSATLPSKLKTKDLEWDELDDLLQVERKVDESEKLYQTMPSPLPSQSSSEHESSESRTPIQSKQHTNSSEESQKTDTEFKSALEGVSLQANVSERPSEEYLTPMNTIKSVDFEDFKQQMHDEFIQNSGELQSVSDNTLKVRQPIDPSRINDSLKLYSEQIMSKSFSGESGVRMNPLNIQYQTLKNSDSTSFNSNRENYALKKSGSAAVNNSMADDDKSLSVSERIINRSKSGPNWYRNNNSNDSDDSETLKPSTIKRSQLSPRSFNIKMDCYDELSQRNGTNGDSSVSSALSTVTTTATDSITTNSSHLYHDSLYDEYDEEDGLVVLRRKKTGSTAIKRRSGNRR